MTADSIDIQQGRHAMQLAKEEWGNQPLKPIGSHLAELVEAERQQCVSDGNWYVASYEAREQKRIVGEIAERGLVPYIALVPRRERHGRGAERTVYRSMFGLYMFVKCAPTPAHWNLVMCTRGIRRLLGKDGKPKPIEERKMQGIMYVVMLEEEKEADRVAKEAAAAKARARGKSGLVWDFSPEQRVKIKKGPCAGFVAELQTAVDAHDRIRAQLALFGGPRVVELSAFDIEAL